MGAPRSFSLGFFAGTSAAYYLAALEAQSAQAGLARETSSRQSAFRVFWKWFPYPGKKSRAVIFRPNAESLGVLKREAVLRTLQKIGSFILDHYTAA